MDHAPHESRTGPGSTPRLPGGRLLGPVPRGPLHTAGELVEQGGAAGGFAILLYVVVGTTFWSLIGWALDHLLGTRWMVIAGGVFGASAGAYLGYLHLKVALNRDASPHSTPSETRKSSESGPRPGV